MNRGKQGTRKDDLDTTNYKPIHKIQVSVFDSAEQNEGSVVKYYRNSC